MPLQLALGCYTHFRMPSFRIPTADHERRWPEQGYRTIALLKLGPTELEHRLSVALVSGVEDGLGPRRGIGLILESGRKVELVWYEHADQSSPTELRAATGDDYGAALAEAIRACHLSSSDVAWIPTDGGI